MLKPSSVRDQPGFERRDEAPQIGLAPLQVEHDIGHALAGAVIGELPAPPAAMHRESLRRDQVLVAGRGAGGVERRMLDQPDALARQPVRNQRRARISISATASS